MVILKFWSLFSIYLKLPKYKLGIISTAFHNEYIKLKKQFLKFLLWLTHVGYIYTIWYCSGK